MVYYDAFIAKWATLAPGTTAEKLAAINAATQAVPTRMIVATYIVYNCIVPSEWTALTDAQRQNIRDILTLGTADVSTGTNVRNMILSVFGAGTQTRANLVAAANSFDNATEPWWQYAGYARMFDLGDCTAAGVS